MANFPYSTLSDDTLRRLTDGELFSAEELSTTTCVTCGGTWVHLGELMGLLLEIRAAAVSEVRPAGFTGLVEMLRGIKHAPPTGD